LLQTGTGGQGFLQTGGGGLQGCGGGGLQGSGGGAGGLHDEEQQSVVICESCATATSSAITDIVKAVRLNKITLFILIPLF